MSIIMSGEIGKEDMMRILSDYVGMSNRIEVSTFLATSVDHIEHNVEFERFSNGTDCIDENEACIGYQTSSDGSNNHLVVVAVLEC